MTGGGAGATEVTVLDSGAGAGGAISGAGGALCVATVAGGSVVASSGPVPFCTYHATPIVRAITAATPRYAAVFDRLGGAAAGATDTGVAASGGGAATDTLAGADLGLGIPEGVGV